MSSLERMEADARVQALVDALAQVEQYLMPRVIGTGGTGETRMLPLVRRAIEGAGVAPTQTSWSDCGEIDQ